jgi:hypothetical protein
MTDLSLPLRAEQHDGEQREGFIRRAAKVVGVIGIAAAVMGAALSSGGHSHIECEPQIESSSGPIIVQETSPGDEHLVTATLCQKPPAAK